MRMLLIAAGILLSAFQVMAGVSVGGTRLVFNASDKEANISVNNSDKDHVYLIQSWVEDTDAQNKKAPFIVTPPLFRLEAEQRNTLRILSTVNHLPADRESLFWLNIKAIPAVSKDVQGKNILQFSVKNRMKLFWRPTGLAGTPEAAAAGLKWAGGAQTLTAQNNTGYYVSLSSVTVSGRKLKVDYTNNTVAPFSSRAFSVNGAYAGADISWTALSDYGAAGEAFHARLQ